MRRTMIAAMFNAGWEPEAIYAYAKSGVLVTEDNERLMDPDDRAAWIAATEEFERLDPEERAATLQAIRTQEPQ
jgi:hypothetical protein